MLSLLVALPLSTVRAEPEGPGLTLPTTPKVPALPKDVPALPKSPAPALPEPPADSAPAATSPTAPAPALGPSAIVDGPAREIEIQIDERKLQPSDGLPASLPKALRRGAVKKGAASSEPGGGGGLTIEEIVNPPISSVSNSSEGALRAPAWTIIITSRDIAERGYTDLSQIFDDLPGMDVIRSYGVEYVRSYARGYRSDVGKDPYIVMVDGKPYSSLFFGDSQILTTFPLSNIDRIEVVYGPASVVHGANAATGLINVVTMDGSAQQQLKDYGSHGRVHVSYGGAQRNLPSFADSTKIVDATASWVNKDWRIRVSGRIERSVLDRSLGENFEFTSRKYYANPDLWGADVLERFPNRAGKFRSSNDKLGVDARIAFGTLELGGAIWTHDSGFGTEYSADRNQSQGTWSTVEKSAWLSYTAQPSPAIASSSVLRYRQSDIAPSSFYLYRQENDRMSAADVYLENQAVENYSFGFQQQLDINVAKDLALKGDELKMTVGFSFTGLSISNDIHTSSSVLFPAGDVTMPRDESALDEDASAAGQHGAEDAAVFVLGSYALSPSHTLNVGGRLQYQNDTYFQMTRTPLVLRAGYVGSFGPVTVKALYGDASVAPSPYELSRAAGSLKNATTRSVEANGTLTLGPVSVTVAGWKADYTRPIVFDTSGTNEQAFNVDSVTAIGLDASARMLLKPFQVWLYYSHYFKDEVRVRPQDEWRRIGDLARDKVWAGVTYDISRFSATLLGRFVGSRHTVATNPLNRIPGYLSLDLNVVIKNVFLEGTSIALRCMNLLDSKYDHPGIGAADSGADPTNISPMRGELNSALPQPRRSIYLSLMLDL